MFETIINETQRIYSHLDGVESAAFSFWLLCVALFYGGIAYLITTTVSGWIKSLLPQRAGQQHKNRDI
jgi:hypothetical protein